MVAGLSFEAGSDTRSPCKNITWFIEAIEVDLIESFELPSSLPRLP
jgi:hypothetical protein